MTVTLLLALAATIAGVSKIPAPITVPTIKPTASINASDRFEEGALIVTTCEN
jgi:hypothetical protein